MNTPTNTKRSNEITIGRAAKLMSCSPSAATARLVALGYTVTCTRCHGSGTYRYNQMDGNKCYGCNGRRQMLVKLTAELVTEALARIAAGELEGISVLAC